MFDDIRQTLRFLRREPRLAVAMLAILAVAIGSTAAIFSVLDAVVIRPLAFKNSDALVVVWQQDRANGAWFTVSPANFLDWKKDSDVFDSLAAVQQFHNTDFNLMTDARPDTVKGLRISPDLFRVLGVQPAIGADSRHRTANPAARPWSSSARSYGPDDSAQTRPSSADRFG